MCEQDRDTFCRQCLPGNRCCALWPARGSPSASKYSPIGYQPIQEVELHADVERFILEAVEVSFYGTAVGVAKNHKDGCLQVKDAVINRPLRGENLVADILNAENLVDGIGENGVERHPRIGAANHGYVRGLLTGIALKVGLAVLLHKLPIPADYLVYDFATVHRADRFMANPISKYKLFGDIEVGPFRAMRYRSTKNFLSS